MALTICAEPGCYRACPGPRCTDHGGSNATRRNLGSSTAQGYGADWRRLRARLIAHHLDTVGPICPGWRRPPHRVAPAALTVDHITPLARGGARLDPANLRVLCGKCNSAKRDAR